MKTSQATINLVLNKQRPNKQGLMPVVLRVSWSKKRATKQTGIYVADNQWDAKKQAVKMSVPECGTLNQRLFEIKSEAIKRLNMLVASGRSYTADDIISDRKVTNACSLLSELLEDMISFKGLSHNTAMAYRASVRRLSEAGIEKLSDISPEGVQGLCKRLKGNGLSDSSVNSTMACLGSIWKFGVDRGYCEGYLFSRFRHWKKYRIGENKVSLSQSDMETLLSYFLNQSVDADGFEGIWWYKKSAYIDLMNRNSELFALCCFLLCYHLQGLAFADLVRIKSENIKIADVDGVRYYQFTGLKRKKTNKVIKDIFVEITDEVNPLFHIFYDTMDKRDGYFLPVLQNNELRYNYGNDAKKIAEATGTCSVNVNKCLRSVFAKLDLDVEGATFYTARHTFATHYMMNGGNPVLLAELMGRSVNGIFRYVTGLTSNEQNIKERNRVFGKK